VGHDSSKLVVNSINIIPIWGDNSRMGKQYVNKDTRETSLVILTENGTTPNLVSSTTTSTH